MPYDGVSPLYGVTGGGGANNGGTVFELTNSGGHWSETVLDSFCSQGGEQRQGWSKSEQWGGVGSVRKIHGIIFIVAVTVIGSHKRAGPAFESHIADTWTETVLYRFG